MKTRIKLILKKVIITHVIILTLFPALFSGFALGADAPVLLTTERAGNYVSTFAINFFKNWSNINYIYKEGSSNGGISNNGEYIVPLDDGDFYYNRGIRLDENHYGQDYSSPQGTVIHSICAGEVVETGYEPDRKVGRGNFVVVKDKNNYFIEYMHMFQTPDVSVGNQVEAGTKLGIVGNTGASEGNHLHVDIYVVDDTSAYDKYGSQTVSYEEFDGVREQLIVAQRGNRYYICPRFFIENNGNILGATTSSSTSSTSRTSSSRSGSVETYGEIKTEYDSTRDERSDPVDASDETYKFSNKSFIDFAFKNALGLEDTKYYPISNYSSSSKYYEEIGGTFLTEEGMVDVTEMMKNGRILPGDIIYTSEGLNGTAGDYLLYVGGTKVIYATKPYSDEGALRYENLQYYLARLKNNLVRQYLQEHPDADKTKVEKELPVYGVRKIYRVKEDLIKDANIYENSENLFFNGKGYYDPNTKYSGIPVQSAYLGRTTVSVESIVESLKDIFWFLVSLMTLFFRAVMVGWVSMVDLLIQTIVTQLSGSVSHAPIVDQYTGIGSYSYSSERISIESILFNGIPIIDANFFNFESAGGHDITAVDENGDPTMIYTLRQNLATWYVVIRNFSIGIMLFMLLYIGIRMAISTTAQKKADYKKMLLDWLQGFIIVIFIHFFMYAIFFINDQFVRLLHNLMEAIVNNLMNGEVDELSLYEAIRTKAYVFDFLESITGLALYIILIYLLVRFLLIYFKRAISVYILAMIGSFIGVKYAWEKAAGKKRTSIGPWMKDFAFNVLLQSIHCLIYVLFMTVAFSTAIGSISGLIICFVILRFMLDADKIFMKIFGVGAKGGLFDETIKPGNYRDILGAAGIITIGSKKTIGGIYNTMTGKNFLGETVLMAMYANPDDDYKAAKKKVEMKRFEKMGKYSKWLYENFPEIQELQEKSELLRVFTDKDRLRQYSLLAKNISYEDKMKIYGNIKKKRDMIRQRYKRPITRAANIAKGAFGIMAAPALIVSSDSGWALALASTQKGIKTLKKELDIKNSIRYGRLYRDKILPYKELADLDKFKKDLEKIETRDEALVKISEYEENINEAIERLKQITPEDQLQDVVSEYIETINKTTKTNISSAKIARAVSTYMVKNNKTKLSDSDLKDVMKELQIVLDEKKSNKIRVSTGNDARDEQFVQSLRAAFSGANVDGLDSKKASALIVKAINEPGVIQIKQLNNASGDVAKELKFISDNYKKLFGLNEETKVKTKENAISFKDFKKDKYKKVIKFTEVKK